LIDCGYDIRMIVMVLAGNSKLLILAHPIVEESSENVIKIIVYVTSGLRV